jgi:hypothetical protein
VFPLLNTQIQHDRVTIICGSPVGHDAEPGRRLEAIFSELALAI